MMYALFKNVNFIIIIFIILYVNNLYAKVYYVTALLITIICIVYCTKIIAELFELNQNKS